MNELIKKSSANIVLYFTILDSTAFTPETGITVTTLDMQYIRELTAVVAKVDAIVGTGGLTTHVDNKIVEVDAASSPGLYMACFPDAAFASGADKVTLVVTGTGFAPTVMDVQLVDFDPNDGVRLGVTALPNANADSAGGLPVSDAGGLDLDALDSNINDIETDTNEIQGKLPASFMMGSSDGADDDGTLNNILTDTAVIGAAGAGLNDLGGMSTAMKAEVNVEVDGALDTALPGSPTTGSINDVLDIQRLGVVRGAAITGTLSATEMTTDLTEATDNHYNGRVVVFLSGVLLGQATVITDYTGATKLITMTALTEAPANTDTFIIV